MWRGLVTAVLDDGVNVTYDFEEGSREAVDDHCDDLVELLRNRGVIVRQEGTEGFVRHYQPRRLLHVDVEVCEVVVSGDGVGDGGEEGF